MVPLAGYVSGDRRRRDERWFGVWDPSPDGDFVDGVCEAYVFSMVRVCGWIITSRNGECESDAGETQEKKWG